MNRQIRILLIVFIACLIAIVGNLAWIQIFGAEEIAGNANNKRRMVEEYAIQRGEIITADNQVAALSMDTSSEYRYQREYPFGPLYSNIIGYDSWKYGRTGLEERYNNELLGKNTHISVNSLKNLLLGSVDKGNSLVLSVDSRVQEAARAALGGNKGAIVALDPKTGGILSMVTSPAYDNNIAVPIPGRDTETAWNALQSDPNFPLVDRAITGLYPPGSSFKVVTVTAALDSGIAEANTTFKCGGELQVQGFAIHDFGNKSHGELTLIEALVRSCNISFAQIGLRIGSNMLVEYAELFGFNEEVPFDLPAAVSKIQDPDTMDLVDVASSSIGQGEVIATPLEMALVASCIANNGEIMEPYLVEEVRDPEGGALLKHKPSIWQRAATPETAGVVNEMMVKVVERGTGTAAQIKGVEVAGKTGTAEIGEAPPHAWFICFAPAEDPVVAVAVIVEHGGEGGKAAAPIARKVLEAALSI
ncbi:MAG: penicillin-binding protein A [Actinobacteria bacterium]|nr:penicillin-binding protein A [Actinomycetota bacterium]